MEFAIAVTTNFTSKANEAIFQVIKRHVCYIISHKNFVKLFKGKMESLKEKRKAVQQKVDAAERNVEKIYEDVKRWCERADETIAGEVKKVEDLEDQAKAKCFLGLCPQYRLSRKAEEAMAVVDKLLEEGLRLPEKVGFLDVPEDPISAAVDQSLQQGPFDKGLCNVTEDPISAASNNFMAFDSRKVVFEEIKEALKDSTISMIGVYGMGGVGKTTLVNEVARQFQRANLFCPVVHVTVTGKPKYMEIQDHIAESLGLKFNEKIIDIRARRLVRRLKQEKKILVVLDDIWEKLDLKKIGIPFGDQHNRCKMLLTSRNRDVLTNEMDVKKIFPISSLGEEEARELFKMMAKNNFENQELLPVANQIVQRCAGLPVAIITIAKVLRNRSLDEWNAASLILQRPCPENLKGKLSAPAYSAIELSYEKLESKELKWTFLLSFLLGNNAHIQDLLRYAIGFKLFDRVPAYTVDETRIRVSAMVSDLKASCLLLDGYNDGSLVMHDFVWDVALAIASRDHDAFALRHGDDFEEWEKMDKFKMISLSLARIKELPCALECPQLSLFNMGISGKDSYVEMQSSFFEKIEKHQSPRFD